MRQAGAIICFLGFNLPRECWARIGGLLLCVFAVFCPAQAEDTADLVKAGFITKFPAFIKWPKSDPTKQKERFIIGVIGKTPISEYLREVLEHTTIEGVRSELRMLNGLDGIGGCDILFISGSEKLRLKEILLLTKNEPILTIADTPGFCEQGVLISFFVEQDQVRFSINKTAVVETGLVFSFRLFQVARVLSRESR